jgi:outer membrane protein assembly factor BamB
MKACIEASATACGWKGLPLPPVRFSHRVTALNRGMWNKVFPTRRRLNQGLRLAGIGWLLGALPMVAAGASVSRFAVTNDAQLIENWSIEIGNISDSSPAVDSDGTIYFGTWTGGLWAVSSNGVQKWLFKAGSEIKSSPAVAEDGTIFFGSRDRKFYALRPDGSRKWSFPTRGWVDSSPALASDGTVYFGSWDKNLYALNSDGSLKWQFTTDGEIVASPAIGLDGTIYFGSHDKTFYALGPDGRKRWTYATAGPILASPALQRDQRLYFSSVDGFFYALNLDGTLKWRLRTGGITEASPVIGFDGIVYVPVNEKLWAITNDGEKKWERDFQGIIDSPAVVFADRTIACVNRGGEVIGMDEERGFRWRAMLNLFGYSSLGVAPDGTIYTAGNVKRFRAFQGVPLAPTAWPKFRGNSRNTGNVRDNQP